MKQVKLTRLEIRNFKAVLKKEIDFSDRTTIRGRNESGKTTFVDAFNWALFGVNSAGETERKFGIRPNPEAFPERKKGFGDTEVTVFLSVDGQTKKLHKKLAEKYPKKRGTGEKQAAVFETSYEVNDLPIKTKKEYESIVEDILPRDTFKLLSDVKHFSEGLHWKERRSILMELIKDWREEDYINEFQKQNRLHVENYPVETHEKLLFQIKEKKQELEDIPVRIDEKEQSIVEGWKEKKEEAEQAEEATKKKIQQLEKQIEKADFSEKNKKIREEISGLENEKQRLIYCKKAEERETYREKDQELDVAEQELDEQKRKLEKLQQRKKRISEKIEDIQESVEELRKHYAEVSEMTFEDDTTCYACGQKLPAEKIIEMKENFLKNKTHKLNEMKKEGIQKNKNIQDAEKELEDIQQKISEVQKEKQEKEKAVSEKEKEMEELKKKRKSPSDFEELPEVIELSKKIQEKQAEMRQEDSSQTDKQKQELAEYRQQLEEFQRTAAELDFSKDEMRIQELEKKEKELYEELVSLEGEEEKYQQYFAFKYSCIEKQVNSRFESVYFRLFEEQKNGGIANTCTAFYKGVPWIDLNSGGKILAGLDIINTISKIMGVSAPVFVDNAESVTSEIPQKTNQLITLSAEPINLKIETGE